MEKPNVKPIPKYILARIKKLDLQDCKEQNGIRRFYAYFTKIKGELMKITVAVKNRYKKWYCKQVAIHGVHSKNCYFKDITFYYIAGYVVDWYPECAPYPRLYYNGKWLEAEDKYFDPYAPVVNLEYALKFPEYKYSAITEYFYCTQLKYLRLYEQFPECEMLVKFGLQRLATKKTILRECHKNKNFRKWIAKNREELKFYYNIPVILEAYKTNQPLNCVQKRFRAIRDYARDCSDEIKNLIGRKNAEKFIEYIAKQETSYCSYSDYIRACQYLNIDLSLEKNLMPHDFHRWHEIRTDQYRAKTAEEDAAKRAELYTKFAKIAEKYLPLQRQLKDAYVCIIAKSPQELIREGDCLHHCVGHMNYDIRFIKEQSLIFFVRLKDKPDTPFVTLEYSLSQKRILQCYGNGDTKPNADVLHYVNDVWLPYANRKLKKIAA